jgi:hypothetical protein
LRDLFDRRRTIHLLAFVVLLGSLVVVAWLGLQRARLDLAHANLPQLATYLPALPRRLVYDNALLQPTLFPLVAWLAVITWLASGKTGPHGHHRWLGLAAMAWVWLLPYYADFNETSMRRLQVPAATWFMLSSALLAHQWTSGRTRSTTTTWLWLILFTLSALWSWPDAQVRTNAHSEDDLLVEAAQALPADKPFWLVVRSYAEGPATDLHLHVPTWRFHPPYRRGRVISASDYLTAVANDRLPAHEVYYLQGFRCWMHRNIGRAQSRLHRACRRIVADHLGEAVFARDAVNLGDSKTFDHYGSSATLRVGLWRLDDGMGTKPRP